MSGELVWHDLMTTDGPRAREFYQGLLGWQLEPMQLGGFTAWLIVVGGRRIGSIVPEYGIPSSHWMPYVGVEDVDACSARAAALGGEVCVPPSDVPGYGRFAVLADPQGAYFSLRAGAAPAPPEPAERCFCFDELLTSDPAAAATFYRSLLDWPIETMVMPTHTYRLVKRGSRDIAGILASPPDSAQPPAWLAYVAVADVDAMARRAVELGGQVAAPPRDIPQCGRFAVLTDPTDARFAVFQEASEA